MPWYVADYLRDTMHLTRDQHGAYLLLIMACWNAGGRLRNEPGLLASIAKATPAEWRRLAPVIMPFFSVDGAEIVHSRVVAEREKAARLSDARRASGAKGGRPRKLEAANDEPNAAANENLEVSLEGSQTPSQIETPSPSQTPTESSEETVVSSALDDPNKTAWDLATTLLVERGRLTNAKARAFFGGLLARNKLNASEMLTAVVGCQVKGTSDPQAYLTRAAQMVVQRRAEIARHAEEPAYVQPSSSAKFDRHQANLARAVAGSEIAARLREAESDGDF